ncbi:MAG: hypothetical protein LBT09_15075 [Planctomycetaceae bacterium]|nr:hypothetical protein [Planctomycetaceae bacterium]
MIFDKIKIDFINNINVNIAETFRQRFLKLPLREIIKSIFYLGLTPQVSAIIIIRLSLTMLP